MARLPRYATDAVLIAVGLLLAVAVAVDVARSNALAQRMRADRAALRAHLYPREIDPHLVRIRVQGSRDLVCGPPSRGRRARVCIHVVHTGAGAAARAGGDAARAPLRRRDAKRNPQLEAP